MKLGLSAVWSPARLFLAKILVSRGSSLTSRWSNTELAPEVCPEIGMPIWELPPEHPASTASAPYALSAWPVTLEIRMIEFFP
jgi:hypothetical protein